MRLTTITLTLLALAATIGPAIYSGQRNFRWGIDPELNRLAEHLLTLPEQIGAWRQVESFQLDRASRDMLQPFAALSRSYTDGQHVATVFLLLGPTGPTAVHTPDICFDSREYDPIGKRKAVRLEGEQSTAKSQFWQLDFKNKGLSGYVLRTWYAWTGDGVWHASVDPRVEYASNRYLFKLQVAVPYATTEAMAADKSGPLLVQGVEDYFRAHVGVRSRPLGVWPRTP